MKDDNILQEAWEM